MLAYGKMFDRLENRLIFQPVFVKLFYIDLKLIGLLKILVVDANSEKTCQPRDFSSVEISKNITISNWIK